MNHNLKPHRPPHAVTAGLPQQVTSHCPATSRRQPERCHRQVTRSLFWASPRRPLVDIIDATSARRSLEELRPRRTLLRLAGQPTCAFSRCIDTRSLNTGAMPHKIPGSGRGAGSQQAPQANKRRVSASRKNHKLHKTTLKTKTVADPLCSLAFVLSVRTRSGTQLTTGRNCSSSFSVSKRTTVNSLARCRAPGLIRRVEPSTQSIR